MVRLVPWRGEQVPDYCAKCTDELLERIEQEERAKAEKTAAKPAGAV